MQLDAEVLAQRGIGIDARRGQAGQELAARVAHGRSARRNQAGQVLVAPHLGHQDSSAARRTGHREGGRNAGLPGPTLSGDDHKAALEQRAEGSRV